MGGWRPTERRMSPVWVGRRSPLGELLLPLQKGQWRRLWWGGGDSRGRKGFFHLSSFSGNTFCRFFPLCVQTEGKSSGEGARGSGNEWQSSAASANVWWSEKAGLIPWTSHFRKACVLTLVELHLYWIKTFRVCSKAYPIFIFPSTL